MTKVNKNNFAKVMLLIGVVFLVSGAVILISNIKLKTEHLAYEAKIVDFVADRGQRRYMDDNVPLVNFKIEDGREYNKPVRFFGIPSFVYYFRMLKTGDTISIIYSKDDYRVYVYPNTISYLYIFPSVFILIGSMFVGISIKTKKTLDIKT